MEFVLQNVTAILQFGFLGVSFLFVYLAYSNVQMVLARENPSEASIKLTQFFMKTALAFMIFAGPLQWATLWVDHTMKNKPVNVVIAMHHPTWNSANGEILLYDNEGDAKNLINNPYKGQFKPGQQIILSAETIADKFQLVRTQLLEALQDIEEFRRQKHAISVNRPLSPEVLSQDGGMLDEG